MAKKAVQEADEQQKLQTRYDRKMEKRRKQKEKEEKEEKAAKIIGRILGIAIVAALVIIVGTSVFPEYLLLRELIFRSGMLSFPSWSMTTIIIQP